MFLSAIDNRCIIQHGPDPRGGPDRQVWEYIMNFVRLGLKPRVYGGFAVLVVIALALACFAVWELLSIKTEMQKFSAINDNTARALQVSERIGMILRSNLRYTIDADEQATEDAETAEASAIELLKAASDATISEERRTIYNGLQSDVESLRAKRETLVRYGTQMTADRAKLFSGGDELIAAAELVEQSRAAITDQNVALLVNPVESAILLVRVANWRFLATRDPKGPATFKTNADHAVAAIAALEKAELPDSVRPLIGPLKASLSAYMSHFDSMAASLTKSDDLYWNSMMPQADDMAAKIRQALVSLKRNSDTTKTETFATISETISTHEAVNGLALALGVLIAWFVSRSIIRPVAGMTAAMGRLAAGHNEVEIPSRDSTDEIGAMARSVEVFKQNAIARKQADRRIRFMAHHDTLTGLTNRARLIEMLDNTLQTSASGGSKFALHFVDLDRFKEVNDTLGHDAGDYLLTTVAERLRAATRPEDVIARLGGDEFIAVQLCVFNNEEVEAFANRLKSALDLPVRFKEHEIVTTASIGVAVAPANGSSAERLLKSADLALYKAKADGRNCIRFFLPEMDTKLQARIELERIIRDAVLHDRFQLHYQPLFEMSDNRLIGFEALIRLPKDDGTLIAPLVFIPVAEDLRLIDKIGAWVLREACRTAATWPEHLTVAVNLSPAQFLAGSISDLVAAALQEACLAAHRLELEITETLLLGNSEAIMAELRTLKAMGVAIVMDDFGTGYSSLSYLWRFPFDKIKIDRSFMQGFDGSGRDAATVVKTIIALGRELNMRVTVEGVETAKQAAFLDKAHGDQAQGFFFGRPIPASEVGASILADFQKRHPAPSSAIAPETKLRVVKSLAER
jgi:diguanylate cyclase (GGDEF)-like protein